MKIIANRLNLICKEIIPNHQQGFITERSITDTAMNIIMTLRNQPDSTNQYWLLFVDQQKAFDRVNHSFLNLVLRKMNFDRKLTNLVANLFSNQVAYIIEDNTLSELFRVKRGVQQGDLLSPLLYVLAFEPLLNQLEKNLLGIPLRNQFFKLLAYADDLIIEIGLLSD